MSDIIFLIILLRTIRILAEFTLSETNVPGMTPHFFAYFAHFEVIFYHRVSPSQQLFSRAAARLLLTQE